MSFSFHAEQMGAGLTLKGDQTPGKWNLMVPNTTGSVVFQVASALKAPLKGAALPPPPPPPPSSSASLNQGENVSEEVDANNNAEEELEGKTDDQSSEKK